MKEIGKLIELLNEYERKINPYSPGNFSNYKGNLVREKQSGYYDNGVSDSYMEEVEYSDSIIISKQFGFIKWLVENDKIDRDKKETEKSDYDITFTGALTMDKKSDLDIMVDTLLMLLSISSSPIEDLISYLK